MKAVVLAACFFSATATAGIEVEILQTEFNLGQLIHLNGTRREIANIEQIVRYRCPLGQTVFVSFCETGCSVSVLKKTGEVNSFPIWDMIKKEKMPVSWGTGDTPTAFGCNDNWQTMAFNYVVNPNFTPEIMGAVSIVIPMTWRF